MEKATFLHQMSLHHPTASKELLELAWQFLDFRKAESYATLLRGCNSYADIAWKTVRRMYVNGDLDGRKALSERFLNALLPFVCMDREPKAHSAAYHVRQMLEDRETRAARQRNLSAQRGEARKGQYAIQAQFNITTDSKEVFILFRQFFQSLESMAPRTPSLATWTSPRRNSAPMVCQPRAHANIYIYKKPHIIFELKHP